jgi:hypothetical protein
MKHAGSNAADDGTEDVRVEMGPALVALSPSPRHDVSAVIFAIPSRFGRSVA